MAAVEFKSLTKVYDGDIVGINDLNLCIADKEFVVLLGPSGCGKSTLLRLIAGLEEPESGEIIIDGDVVNKIPPKNRNVAMVFQDYALYPHMSVRENLTFPLKMKNTSRERINELVKKTAELTGLTELLERKPKQLSGGQRQRVALGRAIIREPVVFLFDEPLSNLDFNLRIALRREIAELHKRTGITTIYVTHDQQEALALGDRVGILKDGKLIQYGKPMELYEMPDNLFVAEFIGNPRINLIDVDYNDRGELVIDNESFPVEIPRGALMGKELVMGARAHNMQVSKSATGFERIIFPAVLSRYENQGDAMLLEFMRGDNRLNVKRSSTEKLILGENYYLSAEKTDILLFDRGTGIRIYP